jgi:hypothetical protein
MLVAARQRRHEGRDVVAGYVESHADRKRTPSWKGWRSFRRLLLIVKESPSRRWTWMRCWPGNPRSP